ncbi:unnamed protein product [Cuscuta epithymum]|uniref:Uncharacterized protein n=1 Tax=Cuscuta epithymum TaxID=186058 RepID=A0AAV0EZM7_9ASTE|nr:unnamed protein product [Cuscuta epithymum]
MNHKNSHKNYLNQLPSHHIFLVIDRSTPTKKIKKEKLQRVPRIWLTLVVFLNVHGSKRSPLSPKMKNSSSSSPSSSSSSSPSTSLVIGLSKALLISGVIFFIGIVLIPNIRNCPADYATEVVSKSDSATKGTLSSVSLLSPNSNHLGSSSAPQEDDDDPNAPTSLKHLMFGMVGSEAAWHHRKPYVESWWRPNHTRGYLFLDVNPTGDLLPWSPLSPRYKISENITRVVQETGHVDARVARMVHGIRETVRAAGDNKGVRWVVMGDDDTIFMVDNLVQLVAGYDHTKYYYIGGQSEFVLSNFWFSFNQAFGGAGFVLSYPLAKAMSDGIMDCLKRYSYLTSADKTTMSCVADLGVNISPHRGFHQLDMRGDISGFLSYHPNVPLMSLHHFDMADPIFPFVDRAEAAHRIMKSAQLDQSRVMQQVICYHRPLNWSFSLSWGYSAQIYERRMPRSYLQNPIETFLTWGEASNPPFWMFDVRPPLRRPLRGSSFLLPQDCQAQETSKTHHPQVRE